MWVYPCKSAGVQSVELHLFASFKGLPYRLCLHDHSHLILLHRNGHRNHICWHSLPLVILFPKTADHRVDLYKIRRNGTLPQGLLMGTIFLMLAVIALNYSLTMVVAPQYAHFGNQRYCNHTIGDFGEVRDCTNHPDLIFPCSAAKEAEEICTPAVVSTFIDRITLAFPFFGQVAFWGQFAFLGVWVLAGVAGVLRRPKLDETGGISEDEDEETTGLLEH
jgi:hypothetical protein